MFSHAQGRPKLREGDSVEHKIFSAPLLLVFIILSQFGCKTSPNKAESVQTQLDQPTNVSGTEMVGLKNGEMVVLDKIQVAENLRDSQNSVYALEDQVYGTRKLGSLGLYGELKSCYRKLASRQNGGGGNMVWTEPLDRVTDKEEDLKLGLDEKKELVGVSEEYLRDRLKRFQSYRMILQKRHDEFGDRIEQCKADLATKVFDASQSSKVMVSEAPKASQDKVAINIFMCNFVKPGASLQNFMMNAFAHGWLSLSDFRLDQNMIGGSVKDAAGITHENAFLFSGWKMAFDKSSISVGDLLGEGKDKDAHLQAWTYDRKADVAAGAACLPKDAGLWNP